MWAPVDSLSTAGLTTLRIVLRFTGRSPNCISRPLLHVRSSFCCTVSQTCMMGQETSLPPRYCRLNPHPFIIFGFLRSAAAASAAGRIDDFDSAATTRVVPEARPNSPLCRAFALSTASAGI